MKGKKAMGKKGYSGMKDGGYGMGKKTAYGSNQSGRKIKVKMAKSMKP